MSAPTLLHGKRCTRCRRRPRRGPKQRWCLRCHAAANRATRPTYGELSPLQRLKSRCRSYTNMLIRRGVLVRGPCAWPGCVYADTQAHHPDYTKPRLVVWFCRPHHLAHHRTEGVQSVHVVNTPGHAGQEG